VSENHAGSGLTPAARAALDALLESERVETSARLAGLVRQLEAIIESSALSVSDDEHDPEGATVGFERAQVAALVSEARRHLDAVDHACERLLAGTYGICEVCGRPIGIDRINAVIVARTCVGCATDAAARIGRISSPGSG